ncbi:MAG TPA: hypothetical protein VF272_00540, partial [Candidatus Saccharimonadia bacterium]
PPDLTFSPSNWRQLYWMSDQGLRRLDMGNNSISAVLASNVAGFTFDGNRMLYVSHAEPTPSLWVLDANGETKRLADNLPVSQTYNLDFAHYIRTPMLAVVAVDSRKTLLYRNLYHSPRPIELPAVAASAVFNGDGRFLLQFDESHSATYDLQENTTYSLPPSVNAASGVAWLGNFHLLSNQSGSIMLSEYDGNYLNTLTKGGVLPAFVSGDTRSVIVASPNAAGAIHIRRVIIRE